MELGEPRLGDWGRTVGRIAILGGATALAALTLPPWVPILVGVVGTAHLIRWHARTFGYRCPGCGTAFVIGPLANALSLSGFSQGRITQRVRCPTCGTRRFMRVLVVRRT